MTQILPMKIHLLGSVRVLGAGARTLVLSGVCARLLGFVALRHEAAGTVSRARLAGTLWPEAPEDQARHLLSNALYRLRRLLEEAEGRLQADAESVRLQGVWLDTSEFRRGVASERVEDWLASIELYSGDLLEEEDAPWLLEPRAELQRLYLAALARTCTVLEARSDPEAALLVAHRWSVADPFDESAHAAAIRLYGQLGRLDAAVGQYRRLAELLRSELGTEPLPETRALVESVRSRRSEAAARAGPRRFVGRRREREALLAVLEPLRQGRGGLVLVEGEAGIGKTRLLQELAEAARWRGLHVAWGLGEPAAGGPYRPLPQALAALLAGPRLERAGEQLSRLVRQLLASLVPQWRPAGAARDLGLPPSAGSQGLRAALGRLLRAAGELEPAVLLLDDVHLAGEAFWPLLSELAASAQASPLLLVLSYRSSELRPAAGPRAVVEELDRHAAPLRLALEGLAPGECAELALGLGVALDEASARRQHRIAGGNPLLLEELLLHPRGRSPTLQALLAERAASLTPQEERALAAASVLGLEVPHGVWQAMLGTGPPVQELLSKRFLHETERGYTFQHDLVRTHLYRSMPERQRRQWHARAAQALTRERAPAEALAWHFEEGECWPEAAHQHGRAAELALRLGNLAAAREHGQRAQALLGRFEADGATRLRLRLLHLRLGQIEARSAAAAGEAAALEAQAAALGDHDALLQVLELQMDLLECAGRADEVRAKGRQALDLARQIGELPAEIRLSVHLARKLLALRVDVRASTELSVRAAALAEVLPGGEPLLAAALGTWVWCCLRQEQAAQARELLDRLDALLEAHPELAALETDAVRYRSYLASVTGRWEESLASQERLIEIHGSVNDDAGLSSALSNASHLALFIGQYEAALLHAEALDEHVRSRTTGQDRLRLVLAQCNLAYCATMSGDLQSAEAVLAPLLDGPEPPGPPLAAMQAWFVLGNLRFYQQRLEEAFDAYGRALAEGGAELRPFATIYLSRAETACLLQRRDAARECLQLLAGFEPERLEGVTTYLHYVRFLLDADPAELEAARRSVREHAARFSDPALGRDFLERIPLHRDIELHWQRLRQQERVVWLVRQGVPVGKPLQDEDYLEVLWSPEDPEQDAALLASQGKAALRRQRLQRLVQQAAARGAEATCQDLARALGVSVSTIERDCRALAAQGQALPTRGSARGVPREPRT